MNRFVLQALIAEQKRLEAEAAKKEVLKVIDAEIARRKRRTEEVRKDLELKQKQQQLTVKIAEAEAGIATAQGCYRSGHRRPDCKTQMLVAAGYDEIEAKRLALLASGQYTAASKLEEEQRKKTAEAAEKQKMPTLGSPMRCGPPWLLLSKPPMPRKPPPTKLKPPTPPPAVRCKVGATGWARCRIRPSRNLIMIQGLGAPPTARKNWRTRLPDGHRRLCRVGQPGCNPRAGNRAALQR